MEEKTYQTPCGTIHYWTNVSHPDEITLVFLPGLTADHRLFDKQIQHFKEKYNVESAYQTIYDRQSIRAEKQG